MAPGSRLKSVGKRKRPNVSISEPIPSNMTVEGSDNLVRNVRGKNRGIELDTMIRKFGKPELTICKTDSRPVGDLHEKLPREIGVLVRQLAPQNYENWYAIDETARDIVYDRIMDKFDIDLSDAHVKKCVDEIEYSRYKDYRCRSLHKYYKKLGGGEVARQNPPADLINRKEQWLWLCDYFCSDVYQKRSNANTMNRATVHSQEWW